MPHHPQPGRSTKSLLLGGYCLAIASTAATGTVAAGNTSAGSPDAETLLNARNDDANWLLPAKTYAGNRYTGLNQIDKNNVGTLG
ncbi:MAG: hypothetical protein JOZ17_26925, partial [Acetobacteraceae bacterium]|nr:hypothetical protein [Acetobacteraceae bacterium]